MIFGFLFFIFGLCLGSFLNAFLYRYSTKQKLTGRSFCPACKHQLAWHDLIPILSWFFLNKRCRYCKKQISVQYPAVELLMGILTFSAAAKTGLTRNFSDFILGNELHYFSLATFFVLVSIFFILLAISVYDYKNKEIPNGFNLFFVINSLIYIIFQTFFINGTVTSVLWSLASGVIAFLFFFAFVFFSKETWMGGGDAKLAFGIGIFLGPINTFVAIFLASIIGSVYGIGTIAINKKRGRKELSHEIPFGPFLVLGTIAAFFFGSNIFAWYAKIFLGF